jgi:hypothetical protein
MHWLRWKAHEQLNTSIITGSNSIAQKVRSRVDSPAAGYALLAIAFLVGLTKVYFGRFVDEADNITVGWLLSEGYNLYRDVFSHHFPFPYYWVAGVVSLFGNSFAAIRISLLLLQVGLLAAGMRLTGFYLPAGLAALAWNLINQFHRGQEAIYPVFEGLFMLAAFMVVFALLLRRIEAQAGSLVFTGVLLGLAVLCDPLMIYPAGVALAGVYASGTASSGGRQMRLLSWEGLRRLLIVGAAAGFMVSVFALHLLVSGAGPAFYRSAIWFNAEIYAKYVDASPLRVDRIIANLASGLKILNPRWVEYTSPFIPLTPYRSVSLNEEAIYVSWIFSGLLFRLSVLACVLGLVLKRKTAAGAFLYVFAAALLVRADDGFYTIGFTLISLFASAYLLTALGRPIQPAPDAPPATAPSPYQRVFGAAWTGLLVVIALMQAWSSLRGGFFLASHPWELANSRHIKMYERLGDEIKLLACSTDEVELSVFPVNPIVNFVTGVPPASRYTFMYPWVAEIGQKRLISELRANESAVVWINTNRKLGAPDSPVVYMAETLSFLNENYIPVSEDLWVSPQLFQSCPGAALEGLLDMD